MRGFHVRKGTRVPVRRKRRGGATYAMMADHSDRFRDPWDTLQPTRWERRHHSGILAPKCGQL